VRAMPGDRGSTAIGHRSTQDQKASIRSAPSRALVPMTKSAQALQREQRLAAKLRENLKRRKGQAKARADADTQAPPSAPETPPGKDP
jgi:hypothetical protein